MASKLKDYFPLIREREEVLAEIRKSRGLNRKFNNWTKQQQEEFLAMCTGVKGLKLLYDGFFKEVMNPEYVPERLGGFLSCLLDRELKVIHAIPMDSTRIADESVLMAMDIVVQLSYRLPVPRPAQCVLLGGFAAAPVQEGKGKEKELQLP